KDPVLQCGAAGQEWCIGVGFRHPRACKRSIFKLVLQNLAVELLTLVLIDDLGPCRSCRPPLFCVIKAPFAPSRDTPRVGVEALYRTVALVTDVEYVRAEALRLGCREQRLTTQRRHNGPSRPSCWSCRNQSP